MKDNDELGNFIRANRDAFDDQEPPSKVWNAISDSMQFRTSIKWYNKLIVWKVAAMLFLGLSIYLLIPKNQFAGETSKVALNEFQDVEAFYIREISQKVELIEEISQGETADEFTQDFQQLEAMYLVLKEELKSRPSKKVKEALVLNLLVRINLLNQQLHRLEEEYKEDNSEKDQSQT